ncbi:HalOD1 output domain-containing protein [Halopelagius fulvigenes]|uniref:HalOD1 output domain-containing protein n=1 Tax=Halopelagius fulvigenes TaxID=1198324 RepID=A0ABD5U2A4_9EURY
MASSTQIIENIISEINTPSRDLPPLYETIDPEILAEFVNSVEDETTTIMFCYCGHKVTVRGDGEVMVTQRIPSQLKN